MSSVAVETFLLWKLIRSLIHDTPREHHSRHPSPSPSSTLEHLPIISSARSTNRLRWNWGTYPSAEHFEFRSGNWERSQGMLNPWKESSEPCLKSIKLLNIDSHKSKNRSKRHQEIVINFRTLKTRRIRCLWRFSYSKVAESRPHFELVFKDENGNRSPSTATDMVVKYEVITRKNREFPISIKAATTESPHPTHPLVMSGFCDIARYSIWLVYRRSILRLGI
jgi:hypothetical protein